MSSKKVRLLFVTPCFEEGGGERFFVNLFRHIDTDRFDITLLSWQIRESHFLQCIPEHVKHIDFDLRGRFRHKLPRLIWKMARVFRREKPDVIVSMLNEWHLATFLAVKLSGVDPAIVLEEQGGISCWLDFLQERHPTRARIVRFLYRNVYLRYADVVICCSTDVANDFVQNFGGDRSKMFPILNPLDIAAIQDMAQEEVNHPWFNDGLPVVIGVGRLTPHKGNRFLVKAFAKVRTKHPSRLVIVADGPERPEIEKMVHDLGVEDAVAILGYQSNPFKFVARSTLFVTPSVSEGCPYVVEEALAVGVPVVAADCTGSAEILEYGKCGLLVPQGDVDALADSMLRMLENGRLRRRLSQLGRQRAQDFSVETITREYEKVFSAYV